jgi:hypothetical protein
MLLGTSGAPPTTPTPGTRRTVLASPAQGVEEACLGKELGASEPGAAEAVGVHRGAYRGLMDASDALHDWIHAQPRLRRRLRVRWRPTSSIRQPWRTPMSSGPRSLWPLQTTQARAMRGLSPSEDPVDHFR